MFLLFVKALFFTYAQAALVSSMPSTFLETGIPNSHLVSENIIRGMAPRNSIEIDNLLKLGVTDFLVFKIDTNGDVAKEIQLLEDKGVAKKNITHLEFPWKDITDFQPICEMTIKALKKIETADKAGRKMFFHCTVGEDRTGYLSGLYLIYQQGQEIDQVFENELCDKGYEAGNPKKGFNVVAKIRESLTPAFLTMAEILKRAKMNEVPLNNLLCDQAKMNVMSAIEVKKYKCKKSKLIH